jgi:hypothetical protein
MQLIVRCLIVTVFPPIRHIGEWKCKVTNNLPKSGKIEIIFNRHSQKIWPNYGQNWDIKEKRFCFFTHLELLAKSLWCPEQDFINYLLLIPIG